MLRILVLLVLLPGLAFAQTSAQRREPEPVCAQQCDQSCKAEEEKAGCNAAIGLTSCRIKTDQCLAVCTRKCPRR